MDGATATSLLKDDPDFQDMPVILVSAMPPEELGDCQAESGAAGTLLRPFSPGDFVRAVRHQLASNR